MQNIKNHKSLFFITKNEIILEATKNKIFKIKDNLKIVVFLIVKILPLIHILFYLFIVFILFYMIIIIICVITTFFALI